MSTLRQVQKDNSFLEGDVEAPKDMGAQSSAKPAATAFAAASPSDAFSAPAGSSHNPVFLAQIIFRKVMTLLLSSDEEDLSRPGGIVTLFKDIILGIILGVLTISCLIFLDHRDVIHFQSAHNFRNAAFQLLNDPETISNIEESSDLKFLTITDYERKMKEIEGVAAKIAESTEVLEKRTAEAEAKQTEIDSIKEEFNKLYASPVLELDKFCGECHWGMKSTCDGRVQFLKDTYNTRPIAAMLGAMKHESCKKQS